MLNMSDWLQVTVWAGVFPIVVSWWAAVALTAFIVAQFLVTSYCRNRKHLKPLWFNSVSNNILWFTFVKVLCTDCLLLSLPFLQYCCIALPAHHSIIAHHCCLALHMVQCKAVL